MYVSVCLIGGGGGVKIQTINEHYKKNRTGYLFVTCRRAI